jgi:hypothetical protein
MRHVMKNRATHANPLAARGVRRLSFVEIGADFGPACKIVPCEALDQAVIKRELPLGICALKR